MRICVICPALGNAGGKAFVGGQENNAVRIAQGLTSRGHHITIVTTPHLHSTPNGEHTGLEWAEVHSLSIRSPYASFMYGVELMVGAVREVKRLSRIKRFDIIHGHSGYPMPALITGLAGRVSRTPSLHTLYCPILPVKGWRPYQLLSHRSFARFYLGSLSCLGVLSQNTRQSVEKIGIPVSRIKLEPPAIDLSRFNGDVTKAEARKTLGLENISGPFLLAVGDLTPRRGLLVLADALKTVKESFPEVKLLLAVNMPLEAYNKGKFDVKSRFQECGLEDNIIPLGIIGDMPRVMAAADIMVAPYISIEGIADYPLSILEAMAMGRPAVASGVGGIPEIVLTGKTGFTAPPGNAKALSDAIVGFLKDPDRMDSWGENGKQFVRENFSLDKIVSDTEQLYFSITGNKS
ncbi:MAG: glycosyltransferase family protein [Dehalococcoidia bacterium]|nr:glycosyltransferase family protein [Dehalococcoidia bacterium]